jgi:hypothetical protein
LARRESIAEVSVLRREVQGLQDLVRAAEGGGLIPPRSLAVGVTEGVVKSLLSASLPEDFAVANRLRVLITTADVSFRSSLGLITLRGRVASLDNSDDYADVFLTGGVATPQVNSMGRLVVRVALDRFEISRVVKGGRESRFLRSAVETLSQQVLDAAREGLAPVEIPVRIQQRVLVPGTMEGSVQIPSGQVPLNAMITRVIAISGRLWILIDISVGRWQAEAVRAAR